MTNIQRLEQQLEEQKRLLAQILPSEQISLEYQPAACLRSPVQFFFLHGSPNVFKDFCTTREKVGL